VEVRDAMLAEWAALHHEELVANWRRAREDAPLELIDPSPSMAGMPELVHVTRVEVVGDHRLRLAFEDSTEAELDFADWQWRGVFEPLADPAYFGQVILDQELGTIVWPNGADVAPETLHAWALAGLERAPA
jgi:hypothetical protein